MKRFGKSNISCILDKENNDIIIHFGKNGNGLTNEFIIIGGFIKHLSEKFNVYISEANIDSLDDTYAIKLHYIPRILIIKLNLNILLLKLYIYFLKLI